MADFEAITAYMTGNEIPIPNFITINLTEEPTDA